MKNLMMTIALAAFTLLSVSAQSTDKIYFHNGNVVDGKVVKLEEFLVIFKYVNEDAEQTISKRAIERIKYSSGREEQITEKIVVKSKLDWEKVEVLLDKSEIVGLKKADEIQGKTMGFFSGYTSAAGSDKRSLKKLLEAAADMGCPFVYITADKDAKGGMQGGAYGAQGNKKGIAYRYQ
jgi:sRNA-binding regulator protein Hfq